MKYLSLFRLLISHFAKKVPEGVGGGEGCCDNCKRASRFVNVTTRERERKRERKRERERERERERKREREREREREKEKERYCTEVVISSW